LFSFRRFSYATELKLIVVFKPTSTGLLKLVDLIG
jgi:hypothetical protein